MTVELVLPLEGTPSLLRPWRQGDQAALALAANHREVWLGLRDIFPSPYTMHDAETWIGLNLANPDPLSLAIEIEGQVAGGIRLTPQQDVHRLSAELGCWLTPRWWGRGVMTAAVRRFTEWGFASRDLARIFTTTFAGNPASARVLEKAGYQLEGVLRHSILKDGKLLDSHLYARIRS